MPPSGFLRGHASSGRAPTPPRRLRCHAHSCSRALALPGRAPGLPRRARSDAKFILLRAAHGRDGRGGRWLRRRRRRTSRRRRPRPPPAELGHGPPDAAARVALAWPVGRPAPPPAFLACFSVARFVHLIRVARVLACFSVAPLHVACLNEEQRNLGSNFQDTNGRCYSRRRSVLLLRKITVIFFYRQTTLIKYTL